MPHPLPIQRLLMQLKIPLKGQHTNGKLAHIILDFCTRVIHTHGTTWYPSLVLS